jgi:hypothetical protein
VSHLSLEDLTQLRERGVEPGLAEPRAHLEGCPVCQAEASRLDQRIARLKALPTLRPARDHWPVLQRKLAAERRWRRVRWGSVAGLATAAVIVAVVIVPRLRHPARAEEQVIYQAMTRSQQLEQLIQSYNPDQRVTDGVTARVAGDLEDRIARVDRELEMAQLLRTAEREQALARLWRQRVGLLDALMDVHLTRANEVGF